MNTKLYLIAFLQFCISVAAYGQWTDLTSTRNDVTYINESTGWMAGDDGAFLKTTDGGKTWVTQNSPVQYTLENITKIFAFDGGNSLKVVTNNGKWKSPMAIMYTSNDGGATWTRVVFRNYDIIDAHFINASVGWYWAIRAGIGTPLLYSTNDGGASWTEVPSLTYIAELTVRGNTVWALQLYNKKSFIWKSMDLGVTWTSVEITGVFNTESFFPDMQFTDDQNGWICTGFANSFLKTTDGGASWSETANTVTQGVTVREFNFVNSQVGYAYGVDSRANTYNIIKTTDGGTTWRNVYKVNADQMVNCLYFKDENNGIAVGRNGFQLETTDGGNAWQVTNFCTVGSNYPAVDLAFNGSDIWVIGEGMLQTSKDGVDWTVREPVIPYNDYDENIIAFTANGKGILAGDRAFARTSDHGVTWTRYMPVEEYSSDYYNSRIWYDGSGNIWLMKSNGTLYRSADAGQNFNIVFKPTGLIGSDRSVAFQSTSKVWYYGGSTLWRTLDTGKTWIRSTEEVTAIHFVSEDIGWKLVSGKKVYKTIDGGESWTYQTDINHWSPFKFMFFADENVGWVGSTLGFVFKTIDGGATWKNEFTGVLNDYNVMAFSKDSQGEMVGYLGGDGLLRLKSHYKPVPVINLGEVALSILKVMPSAVELTWTDNSSEEDGFVVQRKFPGGTFTTIGTVNTTTFVDNSVVSGRAYVYRVAAFRTNRARHFSNELSLVFTVPDTSAPTVVTTSPATNSVNVDPFAPLQVLFDEYVQLGTGTVSVIDADNQQVIATQDVNEAGVRVDGDTLFIKLNTPLPNGKRVYVQIQPNVVHDLAGNGFAGITMNQWSFTVADAKPPVVVTTQPQAGTLNVNPKAQLFIVFDKSVAFAGGTLRVLDALTNKELTQYTIDHTQATVRRDTLFINLTQALPNGKRIYLQLSAGAIVDLDGNAFAGINGDQWCFSTRDTEGPVLSSTGPEAGAIAIDPRTALVMVFSEPIAILKGTLTVLDADTDEVVDTYALNSTSAQASGDTLTIMLTNALPSGRSVYIHISAGSVADLVGNKFSGISDKQWRFAVQGTVTGIEPVALPWRVEAEQSIIRVISTNLASIRVSDVLGRPVELERKSNEVQFKNTGGVFIISGTQNGQTFAEKIMVLR